MLTSSQMDVVRTLYDRTFVVYVDPSIPKTDPIDLLTDLTQTFVSRLKEWTLDSVELMRAIIGACDVFEYETPSPDHELFMVPDTSVRYTVDLEEDISTLLWHGRSRHATALSYALAERLCQRKPEVKGPFSDSVSSLSLLRARLEVLVHPWPLKEVARAIEETHTGIPWEEIRQDRGSPLQTLALFLYLFAGRQFVLASRTHFDAHSFSETAVDVFQTAAYFMAESVIGKRMQVAHDCVMPGEYHPYWALHMPKYPEALDASEFMYIYIHEMIDIHPGLLTSNPGRRILRGLALYAGQKLALEFHQRPIAERKTLSPVAFAYCAKRPLSPTPPSLSEDEKEDDEQDLTITITPCVLHKKGLCTMCPRIQVASSSDTPPEKKTKKE